MQSNEHHYPHCTHHPNLPRNQLIYLLDAPIDRARLISFDITRHVTADWDAVTDQFNADFEGTRVPGREGRETKKSVEMLRCALGANTKEFTERFREAHGGFRAEGRTEGEELGRR